MNKTKIKKEKRKQLETILRHIRAAQNVTLSSFDNRKQNAHLVIKIYRRKM